MLRKELKLSKKNLNKKYINKTIAELKREIIYLQKWHEKTYNEVLVLLVEMKKDPVKRTAKKF